MTDSFAHPWLSGLFADAETASLWSAEAQLKHMLAFEAAWSRNGHLAGLWSEAEGAAAAKAIEGMTPDMSVLAAGTGRDGLPVPALVKMLKAEAGAAVHKGATSQDVIDTATVLSIQATLDVFADRLRSLGTALEALKLSFGTVRIMGRTRMQAALTMDAGHRIDSWAGSLDAHLSRVEHLTARICKVQVGGAVGDRSALGAQADEFVAALAGDLGLDPASCWHARRDDIAELASLLSLISGRLGKFGQDVALMAQQGVDEIRLKGGGGSSAMPHKQNPILAELLVTLARYNAVQVAGMHQALVHEQERSGAAWTLEWMILPQMVQATGRGLAAAFDLAKSIERIGPLAERPSGQ